MEGKKFVLDEWVWADLSGENGRDKVRESFRFLEAVFERCDKIVVPTETEFTRKFWDLCEMAARNHPAHSIVGYVKQKFIYNSKKGILLERRTNSHDQPGWEASIKPDDRYLILAFRQSGADLLITTDLPLIRALQELGIPVVHRDDYLREYLCGK